MLFASMQNFVCFNANFIGVLMNYLYGISDISDIYKGASKKGEDKILRILESAIDLYAAKGKDFTNFSTIAERSGVTRQLIQHYFASREEIFEKCVLLIRINMQKYAIETFKMYESPVDQFRQYVNSVYNWCSEFPDHMKVWVLFYYECSINNELRSLHSEMTLVGQRRIIEMIVKGKDQGLFGCTEIEKTAKIVQSIITGGVITISTENLVINQKDFVDSIVELSLKTVISADNN